MLQVKLGCIISYRIITVVNDGAKRRGLMLDVSFHFIFGLLLRFDFFEGS